jgi:ribA/ribD-fused uncharacterized protein
LPLAILPGAADKAVLQAHESVRRTLPSIHGNPRPVEGSFTLNLGKSRLTRYDDVADLKLSVHIGRMQVSDPNLTPSLAKADLPDPSRFSEFYPFIRGVFSQWHRTPFLLEGRHFVTAEQWMMYAKALLFDDHDVAGQIACEVDPAVQKRLGQQVKGFDQGRWDQWKIDIVYRGNFAKFSQNEGAQRQLRNTGDGLLVEANPRDWVWEMVETSTIPPDMRRWSGGEKTYWDLS